MVKTENILGLPMVVLACFMILFSSAYTPKAIEIITAGIESTGAAMKTSLVAVITNSDQTPVVANESKTAKKPVSAEELKCMADNIYYEAASESVIGKIAVGRVVLNRVKDPRFPKSVCEVVYQGSTRHGEAKKFGEACQFSWTCEGPAKAVYNERYEESKKIAYQLLAYNSFNDSLKNALYFHAESVSPYWSKQKKLIAKIDNHLFYVDK